MEVQQHWEGVYTKKAMDQVSWFRPHLETSAALMERSTQGDRRASIIDVGGGASTLVDDLLDLGYRDLTIVDISQAALEAARRRVGAAGESVRWLCADVTQPVFPVRAYDVWHDRAVFHFLTSASDRAAYIRNVATD